MGVPMGSNPCPYCSHQVQARKSQHRYRNDEGGELLLVYPGGNAFILPGQWLHTFFDEGFPPDPKLAYLVMHCTYSRAEWRAEGFGDPTAGQVRMALPTGSFTQVVDRAPLEKLVDVLEMIMNAAVGKTGYFRNPEAELQQMTA